MVRSFISIATVALLAVTGFAATVPLVDVAQLATNAHCANPQLVNNATIAVGDKNVVLTSLLCSSTSANTKRSNEAALNKRDLWHTWPLCLLFHTCPHPAPPTKPPQTTSSCASSATPAPTKSQPSSTVSSTPAPSPTTPSSPVHVCGASCNTACNNDAGVLPPTSEDCETIGQAIEIFKNQGPTSFVVDSFHVETLSFGTCSYFFINLSDHELEYCWDDLAATAEGAGGSCFPPKQPFTSEGLCTSPDGQWDLTVRSDLTLLLPM